MSNQDISREWKKVPRKGETVWKNEVWNVNVQQMYSEAYECAEYDGMEGVGFEDLASFSRTRTLEKE